MSGAGQRAEGGVRGANLKYLSGGNPPHSPGIYDVSGPHARIVAFWPAWVAPTQERVDNICLLISEGREFVSREEIEGELKEAGLV